MTVSETLEKIKEERKNKALEVRRKLAQEEAEVEYYKNKVLELLFDTTQFYNVKHISYWQQEEYRLYKKPFCVGKQNVTQVVRYEEVDGKQYNKVTKEERTIESIVHAEHASLYRTRQKIYEYAFSNDWSDGLFFTMTFNPDLVNSYDYDECYQRMYQFLKNIKKQNPNFKYIFVPEYHKSGRIHFHGIATNCDKLKLEDSGKYKNGKKIYNISNRTFKYGFTTVSKIGDTQKVSSYITKYITKEVIAVTKGKHRYLCSKNLNVADVENIMVDDKEAFLQEIEKSTEVLYKKTFVNEETEQEIIYVHTKRKSTCD